MPGGVESVAVAAVAGPRGAATGQAGRCRGSVGFITAGAVPSCVSVMSAPGAVTTSRLKQVVPCRAVPPLRVVPPGGGSRGTLRTRDSPEYRIRGPCYGGCSPGGGGAGHPSNDGLAGVSDRELLLCGAALRVPLPFPPPPRDSPWMGPGRSRDGHGIVLGASRDCSGTVPELSKDCPKIPAMLPED